MKQTVNERVKLLRTSLRLTQAEFASDLKISSSLVSKIEQGEEPSSSTIDAIINVFQVDEDWILHGKGELRYTKPVKREFDPATDTLYKEMKAQIIFYQNLLTQMAGGKASFPLALNKTGSFKKEFLRANAA